MPLIRIIIVNFNGGNVLRRCLLALADQTEPRFEIVIVDNNSTDASLATVPDDQRIRVIRLNRNIGFAAGCNRGFEGCATPLIAFLNADAFARPDWLAAMLRATGRYSDAAMFGSLQLRESNPGILDGAGDVYSCAGAAWRGGYLKAVPPRVLEGETFSPCAAAAIYRSEWFRKAGGFDERFFCYFEDVDLGFRVRLLGGTCVQVGDAVVHHIGSAQTGLYSPFSLYHCYRNQLWTFVKCMPAALFWPLLPLHIVYVSYCLIRIGKTKTGAGADARRGLHDGLRGLPDVWRERRRLQAARRVSWLAIARALSWSPLALKRHSIVLTPLP